jgi:hypothetical protein
VIPRPVLFGGAVLHILSNASTKSQKMPLNDFDFITRINHSIYDTKIKPNINLLKHIQTMVFGSASIKFMKIQDDNYYTNSKVFSFVIILNGKEHFVDLVFYITNTTDCTDINDITLNSIPINEIKMHFNDTSAYIIVNNHDQIVNLMNFYNNKPQTYPRLAGINKLSKYDVELAFIVIGKALQKGIKIRGISIGDCICCDTEECSPDEKKIHQILINLCQNSNIDASGHGMCIICFLSSWNCVGRQPLCPSRCKTNDTSFFQIFRPNVNITLDLLRKVLPFKWNIVERNIAAFAETAPKKHATWIYIVFDHNEHELEIAKTHADVLGFEFATRTGMRNSYHQWIAKIGKKNFQTEKRRRILLP